MHTSFFIRCEFNGVSGLFYIKFDASKNTDDGDEFFLFCGERIPQWK